MPDDAAIQYYLDRKRAALAMSQAASDPAVQNIHREMASRYDAMAETPVEKALDVAVLGSTVEIIAPDGAVISLTSQAAAATSDRLLVRAREARPEPPTDRAPDTARHRLSLPTHRRKIS